jgi:hypothetical protein
MECEQKVMKSQIAPPFELGAISCGIIIFVAIIPCAALFSYLDTVFITPSDL